LGVTFTTLDLVNYSHIDSDILIFEKDLEAVSRNRPELLIPELTRTLKHEMGHFLGLDHQFKDEIHSIMSYRPSDDELFDYDKKAILELYPLK
jgi:predicted Zn-dependent protease